MRKKNTYILCFIAFLAVIAGAMLISLNRREIAGVCFKERCFNVELASTPQERSRGLMFREELAQDSGMLFVFEEEGSYSFWMKNTLMPLDIIWISKDKEVVFISRNSRPCGESSCLSIRPDGNAKYVLELNGGVSEAINLKAGDKAEFAY